MSNNFTIPIRKEHVLLALIIVVFGAGMISGSALGSLGAWYGALVALLGCFYAYSQYKKQKKAQGTSGPSSTA